MKSKYFKFLKPALYYRVVAFKEQEIIFQSRIFKDLDVALTKVLVMKEGFENLYWVISITYEKEKEKEGELFLKTKNELI